MGKKRLDPLVVVPQSVSSVVVQRVEACGVVQHALGDADDVNCPVPDERYASAEPGDIGRLKGYCFVEETSLIHSNVVTKNTEKKNRGPADRGGHDRTGADIAPASSGVDAVPQIAR